jgi:diguanylate cyclase (GGDEF)-like protein
MIFVGAASVNALTVTASITAIVGICVGWWFRRRARRAEVESVRLRLALAAERHAARHDSLTSLPNRRAFFQAGAALLRDPKREALVAVVLDIDHFKEINDTFGHAAGDEVLVTIARRFAAHAGDNLVARLGGDEFAGLMISPTTDPDWVRAAGQRLSDALTAPIRVAGRTIQLTVSVGVAPVHGPVDLYEALGRADEAMYRAKAVRRQGAASPDPAPMQSGYRPGARSRGVHHEDVPHRSTHAVPTRPGVHLLRGTLHRATD